MTQVEAGTMGRVRTTIADWRFAWEEDRRLRRVLRGLSRQRVSMIAVQQAWPAPAYIENPVALDELGTLNALLTCHLRGWIEPAPPELFSAEQIEIGDGAIAFSKPRLGPGVAVPGGFPTVWRLTDAGWAAIQRRNLQAVVGIGLAVLAIVLA